MNYFDVWKTQIFFGLGFGSGNVYPFVFKGAHNTFLSVAFDTGLVGVILWISVFVAAFKYAKVARLRHQSNSQILYLIRACEASLIAVIIHANTTGNDLLYCFPVQIMFFLFATFASISWLRSHNVVGSEFNPQLAPVEP
jgi:O-antigen ligase